MFSTVVNACTHACQICRLIRGFHVGSRGAVNVGPLAVVDDVCKLVRAGERRPCRAIVSRASFQQQRVVCFDLSLKVAHAVRFDGIERDAADVSILCCCRLNHRSRCKHHCANARPQQPFWVPLHEQPPRCKPERMLTAFEGPALQPGVIFDEGLGREGNPAFGSSKLRSGCDLLDYSDSASIHRQSVKVGKLQAKRSIHPTASVPSASPQDRTAGIETPTATRWARLARSTAPERTSIPSPLSAPGSKSTCSAPATRSTRPSPRRSRPHSHRCPPSPCL